VATASTDQTTCNWQEPGGAVAARTICAFLDSIGIPVVLADYEDREFVPGMAVQSGRIMVAPGGAGYPGDLLHEAGHIAVADPQRRAAMDEVGDDPGEEMAAIAWSVAAARACGIPLEVLFMPAGYKGGSPELIRDWETGQPFGVPLLGYWGMTSAAEFPKMRRWLR
jgi:hypothetical protein